MVNPTPAIPEEWRKHRELWARKPVLRALYGDLFRRIDGACVAGPVLEVGGGIGAFKADRPHVTSLDVAWAPWLDMVGDAQALPVGDASFANIVMTDVLHHLPHPLKFLAEAERVLKPGGRLIVVEPAITPLSWPFYHFLHQERVDMTADAFGSAPLCSSDPYDANQAVPTLMFLRQPERLAQAAPGLRLITAECLSLLAYPLSGGFKDWSLIPAGMIDAVLRLENRLTPLLGRWLGFRLMAVLERR